MAISNLVSPDPQIKSSHPEERIANNTSYSDKRQAKCKSPCLSILGSPVRINFQSSEGKTARPSEKPSILHVAETAFMAGISRDKSRILRGFILL